MGRRIGKRGANERSWIYRNQLSIVAELGSDRKPRSYFLYGTKEHVPDYMVMIATNQKYKLIHDQLGSVRMVVNASTGAIAQQINYDEFGKVLSDTNPGFQPFGFAGGLYDSDTGLVRFGARDYDAEVGRWVSKDPILFDGGLNIYAYSDGDPINKIDPDGRRARLVKVALDLVVWLIERRSELLAVAVGLCTLNEESREKCLELLGQEKPVPKKVSPKSCDSQVQSCPQTKINQLIKTKPTDACKKRG